MDGAGRAKSAELLIELISQARSAEDEAWTLAAELRRTSAPNGELLEALRVLELTTATRARLERELKAITIP